MPIPTPPELIDARDKGLSRYFTGTPCKHGHVAERFTKNRWCVVCASKLRKPEKCGVKKKRIAAWRVANKVHVKAYKKKYESENSERIREIAKRANSKPLCILKKRVTRKRWAQKNKDKILAKDSRRRAMKLTAIPIWSDRLRIVEIYSRARRISKCLGTPFHVDHEIPLCSKIVCGLHVPDNLRIVPASVNFRKSNKHSPDIAYWS